MRKAVDGKLSIKKKGRKWSNRKENNYRKMSQEGSIETHHTKPSNNSDATTTKTRTPPSN